MAIAPSSVVVGVMGNKRVIMGVVAIPTTADEITTGLEWVNSCTVTSEGTIGGNSEVQIVLNSNDGTAGTSAGDVYIDGGAAQDGNMTAIGN